MAHIDLIQPIDLIETIKWIDPLTDLILGAKERRYKNNSDQFTAFSDITQNCDGREDGILLLKRVIWSDERLVVENCRLFNYWYLFEPTDVTFPCDIKPTR